MSMQTDFVLCPLFQPYPVAQRTEEIPICYIHPIRLSNNLTAFFHYIYRYVSDITHHNISFVVPQVIAFCHDHRCTNPTSIRVPRDHPEKRTSHLSNRRYRLRNHKTKFFARTPDFFICNSLPFSYYLHQIMTYLGYISKVYIFLILSSLSCKIPP